MKIVIIGAGPAGVTVAETVREFDREADILMLTDEPYPPYSPPAMADHFLTGSDTHLWRGIDWDKRLGIDYRCGVRASHLSPDLHRVYLEAGGDVGYDHLVIATGSRLYAPVPGAELPGVYNFKSLSAAEHLVDQVRQGVACSAVIVGAGFIGMEIALLLADLGVQITLIEMLDQVMPAMLDADTAQVALSSMRERGIEVRLNTRATEFVGTTQAVGVRLDTGELLAADLFVAATGVRPNLNLARDSGVACGVGIQVDDHLRTSVPGIYAAGDVIEVRDRLTGSVGVSPIFPNAVEQGRVVALNLLGEDVTYDGAERMNSLKHLGLPIIAAGIKVGQEILCAHHNGAQRTLYLQDDRLVGFQLVGDIHAAGVLRALMLKGEDLRPLKDRLLGSSLGMGTVIWESLELRQ